MTIDKIIVIVVGLFGIVFTYWFFLMKKGKEVEVKASPSGEASEIEIKVSGGYTPDVISIPKGKTTKIIFLRTDPTECLEDVVLSDFKIKKNLPLNEKIMIEITPQKAGEFPFSCGMGMFHGKIIVKE